MIAYIASVIDYLVQYLVVFTSVMAGLCWVKSAWSHGLADQSIWNARAAFFAAVAAGGQAAVFFKTTPFPVWHG
jgi:hypothetical protein